MDKGHNLVGLLS